MQVASESMEPFGVVGIDGCVIVNIETRMSPRIEDIVGVDVLDLLDHVYPLSLVVFECDV